MFCNMRFLIILILFFFFDKFDAMRYNFEDAVSKTINVSTTGGGQFRTIQQAIDSIPSNNTQWIRIRVGHGVYIEKVTIPRDKPYIILQGNPELLTTIEYGQAGNVVESPTFKAYADNFVAKNILFKNTYDRIRTSDSTGRRVIQAPAIAITGDKASFYNCSFVSLQDTVWDALGRHYFYDCEIKGSIDFIWGNGQTIYEKCTITSLANKLGHPGGYITAQGRETQNETTGFVFKDCHVRGSGPIFLGRAYRTYSRVLFSGTYMDNMIAPEGWSQWAVTSVDTITFSEAKCSGPGADLSHRVPWEKKLSDEEVGYLTNTTAYINPDGWLEKQPH